MHLRQIITALFGLVSLTCCALLPRPADSQVVSLAESVGTEAAAFFSGLAAKQAPDCAFPANAAAYDHLAELASALKAHIAASHASPALALASQAMLRTLADARAAHIAASAKTDDINGVCMAPGAIALNAEAIARASKAIAATQMTAGVQ